MTCGFGFACATDGGGGAGATGGLIAETATPAAGALLSTRRAGAWNGFEAEGEDVEYIPFRPWHEIEDFLRQGQWYE